ncbi:MAG TPA: hypothetical protein VII06_05160 [Chloroflexota bacterium]|jgi:hypothetical protein
MDNAQGTRPHYERPSIKPMDRDEVLQAFQMTASQISAAGCWWINPGICTVSICGGPCA